MVSNKLKFILCTIAVFFNLTIFSQIKMNDYATQWKKVDAFEKKGLTKSALKEVLSIYNLALKENNDAQQIKSCMYQIKYRNMVEEDANENNIFFIDTLIAKAKAPAKNILQSIQAELFWQYVQNNRWQIKDRTKLTEEKSKDITTWSLEKLHHTIGKLYKASLSNETILKTTKLDGFDAILTKGINTRQLRPTLYDFLAHRALSYFTTGESDLTKPAYQFSINESEAFAPAKEFSSYNFKTKDTTSLYHKAILLFQEVIKFHLNDATPDALIDVDLERLMFVNNYGVMDGKEKLYETALKNIEDRYPTNAQSSRAMFARAQLYYNRGSRYKPIDNEENQYEIKRAKELLDATIAKFPKSEGAINAQNLVQSILQPSLNLITEKVNVINQPFRTLVQYKNIKTVYLRLIKISRDELKKISDRDYKKYWQAITALPSIKAWSVNLPDPQDFQQHSTEIKVDALDGGTYILLASKEGSFDLAKNILAQQFTYVSNISYIHNDKNQYYVLHRDNGQPLANTQVQAWENRYNSNKNQYELIKAENYTADKNGMFTVKKTSEYRNFLLQLKNGTDELFMDDNHYGYANYNENVLYKDTKTFLFTDRSIYRPNQTVFFKGIVINTNIDANKNKVVPNFQTTVIVKDVNGQKVTELKLTTNDYGSYQGSFKLPLGVLTGEFTIVDSVTNSTQQISVEEYKRPKFFVEVAKPKGTYRVNDSIKVIGTAKGYAGNLIDGATVKYRVVRKVQYPIWWEYGWYKRGGYGRNEEVEITNGTATTDAKGEFKVTFKAQPDESIDKKSQPTFYYEVSADVTDINGETRSAETSVAVAYQALQLSIDIDEKIHADSLKNLKIGSTNINGIFEKANVNVTITKLRSPNKYFRERYWQQPDQFVMSRDEYYTFFPYDLYKNETQKSSWALAEKAVDKTDSTKENGQWAIGNGQLAAGWYKVVAISKDKYGEEVRAEKYIQITTGNGQQTIDNQPILVTKQKTTLEPGYKAEYNIATSFDKIWLIHTLSKMDKTNPTTYFTITKNQSASSVLSVGEQDRGGIAMSYAFVQHNRIYKGGENFNIPWSNKDIQINYTTFRDKLLPGANEKYTIKITGNKGQKLAAEVLASMYDASLDQFKPHNWSSINIWPSLYNTINWQHNGFSIINSTEYNGEERKYYELKDKSYDELRNVDDEYDGNYRVSKKTIMVKEMNQASVVSPAAGLAGKVAGLNIESADNGVNPQVRVTLRGNRSILGNNQAIIVIDGNISSNEELAKLSPSDILNVSMLQGAAASALYGSDAVNGVMIVTTKKGKANAATEEVKVRKNFNETAFFYPQLTTDAEGNVEFSFTIPEALTQWKLLTLAHTKDAASGVVEKTVITQKPLMVQPNAPRFIREGDKMEFSAKVVNLSDKEVTGTATLELIDAATNAPVDGWFKNVFPNQYFTVAAGQSSAIKFPMEVPFNFNSAMLYRIKAIVPPSGGGGGSSDGEEMAIPVLTNRMLVTESMPLNLRGTNSKTFKFEKLINSGSSTTLSNHAVTVEYTSNPAWYAVQALPYLMEYPYECAEQTFNRYYANTLASFVSNSNPKIKAVFEKWKNVDTAALLSNLQKNEQLKSALLQETPWVLEAQNEAQQKKNIALLFDMVKMSAAQENAFNKLKEMQLDNGGFTWFKGGRDDRYMTQYIITGIGHLRKLGALNNSNYENVKSIVDKAVPYLDRQIKEDYDDLIRYKAKLKDNNTGYTQIQYLYMRSFFSEIKIAGASQKAVDYYTEQIKKYWLQNSKYMQGMIALALHRGKDATTPKAIIKSLKENAIYKVSPDGDREGMYWKDWANGGGYYWHQAPIESQAMMIEAFTDIDGNVTMVDDLKTWLLKQKQTQNWKTTKATAEACYALLLGGSNWLAEEKEVSINLGNSVLISSKDDATQAGTGYFKKRLDGEKVKAEMGNVTVNINPSTSKPLNSSTSWGSVYWQYFEDLDKITSAETPLKLKKQLFKEVNTDKGPSLVAIKDGDELKVGDKVKVRIELKVDRDMEYVHMKDMRAACMEPTNVISEYKWQGGLGYYEATKDASTNFFFSWLSRGSYVFEYPMFVTHQGNFSNGITTIQCMYAPEFTSHSEGIRVNVE
jgi:TonB-dependent SusC/RagA subfamily outer membrane receptor